MPTAGRRQQLWATEATAGHTPIPLKVSQSSNPHNRWQLPATILANRYALASSSQQPWATEVTAGTCPYQ